MRNVGFALALVSGIGAVALGACSAADGSAFQSDDEGSGGSGAGTGTGTDSGTGTGTAAGGAGGAVTTTTTSGAGGATTTTSGAGGGSGGAGGATTTSTGEGGAAPDGGAPKPDGGAGPCSEASKLVYVYSSDNDIYSFDPPTKTFTKVATPDCQAFGTPNSMAVDRNLVAWINYIGEIHRFDLKKKSGCQPSGVDLPFGFEQLGMGFATDVPGGVTETLYVDSIGGLGLAKIQNGVLAPIGPFSGDPSVSGHPAELTGTGDAKLFGYFTTSPWVRVAEIDKGSGAILSDHELTGVSPPSSWAFSFWGGEFYLYAAPGANLSGRSTVVRYDPVTKTVDPKYVEDVGFTIVGAGVSTCAPVVHQ